MAERVIIAWNFRNWITIVLMAALGFALLGLIVTFVRGNFSASSGGMGNNPAAQQQPTQ